MTHRSITIHLPKWNPETHTQETVTREVPVSAFASTTYRWGLVDLDTNTATPQTGAAAH